MTLEAEIGRRLYEEARAMAIAQTSVRLPIRMADLERQWPEASRDQLIRALLIAYELLVADVQEAISNAKRPSPNRPA